MTALRTALTIMSSALLPRADAFACRLSISSTCCIRQGAKGKSDSVSMLTPYESAHALDWMKLRQPTHLDEGCLDLFQGRQQQLRGNKVNAVAHRPLKGP